MAFDMRTVREAVRQSRLVYRIHAIQKMFARKISKAELTYALDRAELVEDYPDDKPYPSALLLGFTDHGRPLHVACAVDEKGRLIIITVYKPDTARWERDWKMRRRRP
jgi:hypothetical protein